MSYKVLNGLNGLTSSIASSLRSKKKFSFDVIFTLQEMVGCTYVTGVIFAKIQLKDGGSFSAVSLRNDVENHKVQWDQDFNFSCKMYANDGTLEPCWCKVSIRKETKGGRSCTKLGYAKINLAEFAGAGDRQRKYLLESYNENKHKPDNSVLKVKVDLRQTSGDIVFKAPEGKTWEFGEEDEGFEDNQSMYSRGSLATPRASTGSTMSSLSLGMSSHSSSAANLKLDPTVEGLVKEIQEEGDRDSGSEETVVERTSSHATVDTNTTVSGGATTTSKTTVTGSPSKSSAVTPEVVTVPPLQDTSSSQPSPERTRINSDQLNRKPSLQRAINSEQRSNSITLEPVTILPDMTHTSSFKDVRHSRYQKRHHSDLLAPPSHLTSLTRRSKGTPSVQSSHVTAHPSPTHNLHKRQASMGGYTPPHTGGHKRHSSISTVSTYGEYDTSSLVSSKTRATTLSTLEQSRPDSESVIDQLVASCDLTPASDEEEDANLKLFVDKRSGDIQLRGHGIMDRSRYKEVDIKEDATSQPKPPPRRKNKVTSDLSRSSSLRPQSSFESSTTSNSS